MRLKQICFLLLCSFLLAGCNSAAPTKEAVSSASSSSTETEQASSVATETAAQHYLIDVRSKDEWDSGHLETAIHIPHTEIAEGINKVTTDKSARIHLY